MKSFLAGALWLLVVTSQTLGPKTATDATAGSTALLINQEASQARPQLEQALHHADPSVRTLAARVAAITPSRDLAPALSSSLAGEADPSVAVEEIRDVLLLGGASVEADVDAQVRRRGADAALVYAEWLGRVRPAGLIDKLPELFPLAQDAGFDFTRIVRTAGTLHPDVRDDLYLAWMKVAPASAWRSLLFQAFGRPGTAAAGARVLTGALNSDRPAIRTETVWFVVGRKDIPDAVLDAALPRSVGASADWEAFGREMIARRYKHLQTPERAEFLKSALGDSVAEISDLRLNPDVTAAELAVLNTVPAGGSKELDPSMPASAFTVAAITRGEIESVFESAGCDPTGEHFGVAAMSYADDGRPKRIVVSKEGLPSGCELALTTLARLSLEPRDHASTDGALMFVLPFEREVVGCLDGTVGDGTSPVPPRVDGRRVQAPQKMRNADIFYPPEAQRQRLEGTVMIEAVIGPRGCVQHARVVGGQSPLLDAAALDFVMRTSYKPPIVEGNPAAVAMMVPVRFSLTK